MAIIVLTVTNDLTYDQRMHRICSALAEVGHKVELVGRELPQSVPLSVQSFLQRRLRCQFNHGILFYAEYTIRLWAFLMHVRCDAIGTVDLDTLPAGCLAAVLRRKKRLFDAHEYFTEVPEVTNRPTVKFFWETVARLCLPFYRYAYTVGPCLADIFEKKYGIKFGIVRNMPPRDSAFNIQRTVSNKILLYQGALNAGRGIEQMLEAMRQLAGVELWLAGEGDRSEPLRQLAAEFGVLDRVRFLGFVQPADLKALTMQAWLGINVLENKGLSYYYSLANKFFDYTQAGVPVLTMDFPEYRALNAQHSVAVLLKNLTPEAVIEVVKRLLENPAEYEQLRQATHAAREQWVWENEKPQLLGYWSALLSPSENSKA
ncbi:MAG: glycosyltransferase [Saprospiraceae bacterium]